MRQLWLTLTVLFGVLLFSGCGSPATSTTGHQTLSPTAASPTALVPFGAGKEIVVFAGSSLTDAFNEIGAAFSAKYGGAKVTYNFGGSNQLRAQIEQGARAEVFASANQTEMDNLAKSDLVVGTPQTFVRNVLTVITPKDNPGKIERLQDLRRSGLKLVVALPNVPVGGYTMQMLDKLNADPAYGDGFKEQALKNVISQENNVRQVVAKVQLGEADAGVVYTSDVTAASSSEIRMLEVPEMFNVIASYPIAVTKKAKEPELARAYIEYILSSEGQEILKKHNFITLR